MAKLTLSDLASLANQASAIATINANNALIETALENTLSRDGTSPNGMGADLDMNSNSIINLPDPVSDQEAATKSYVDSLLEDNNLGEGDLVLPGSTTSNALVRWGSTTGGTLKDSPITVDDAGVATGITGLATALSELTLANTGLHLLDTNASHDLIVKPGSNLSADRTLTVETGDADRTLALNANLTVSAAVTLDQAVATTISPTFVTPTVTSINVGSTSTTVSESAAGVIAVEGVPLYSNVPVNSQSAAYTTVLADAQKFILHPTADNNARTFTIDSNANVAYPIGTCITFINQINTVTISITSDTLTWAGSASTGSRTLAAGGMATAIKVTSTLWFISGVGLS
jgi:hypothetical protein